ncbi:MAG TPA: UDP-2,3-diacylglucosamine diphosphatase LpxI [Stellaceae bacterium]|nr:UDP-2,3-diacylglucosamine diphosphatase LpxI [Stellaceae bacterium]
MIGFRSNSPLGIVAGSGDLPQRIADAAKAAGRSVFILALEDFADPALIADAPHGWIRLGAAAQGIALLRAEGVTELVLAGAVRRPSLSALRPDWRTTKFLAKIGMRALGDDGLLSAVIKEIESEGFRIVGADTILGSALAPAGQLGRVAPDAMAQQDIARGIAAVRALGALDIGQAAIVQQGVVLGVEAAEGTERLIARCKALALDGPGGVLVKLAKPGQERRADLPTIGLKTVEQAAAAGLRGIAIEAGAALIVDREQVVAAADARGLFVIGIAAP